MIVTLKSTYRSESLVLKTKEKGLEIGYFRYADTEEITKRRENHECNINEAVIRSGCTFWSFDKTVESKNVRVHLYRKKWYLYH